MIGEFPFILSVIILIVCAWVRTRGKGIEEFIERSILLPIVALAMYLLVGYFTVNLVKVWIQGVLLELFSFICYLFLTVICWVILTKAMWRAKAEKDLTEAVAKTQSAAKSLSDSASKIEDLKRDFEQSKRDFKEEIEGEVFGELDKVRADIPPAAPELSQEKINEIAKTLANMIPKRLDDDEINRIAEQLGAVIKGSASQKEGLDFQQVSAHHLETFGFEVKNSAGRDQPDHLLYVGKKPIAVGSAKCCTIKTSWTLNEERAGRREVSVTKEKNLPLYISIYNKITNRIWSLVIEPRSLENLTLTAPSWLWKKELSTTDQTEMEKNHQETGRQLSEILKAARGRTRPLRVSPKTLRKSVS